MAKTTSCFVVVFLMFCRCLWATSVKRNLSHLEQIIKDDLFQRSSANRGTVPGPGWFHRHEDSDISLIAKHKQVHSTLTEEGHAEDITLRFAAFGKKFHVDLKLTRDLFGASFIRKIVHDRGEDFREPVHRKEHCYYQGGIPHKPASLAAVSSCDGIRGYVSDGQETYHIEPVDGPLHRIFRHSDLKPSPFVCGTDGHGGHSFLTKHTRRRRSLRRPYDATRLTRFVELYLVSDYRTYDRYGKSAEVVFKRSQEIANIVNSLYRQLNIYVVLVGVEVWSTGDRISVTANADTTMENFLRYRMERVNPFHPNDNAQLITGISFDHGVVGKAIKGPICTHQFSGGVSMDYNGPVTLVATTVAHEMGHNFGMEHDNDTRCSCPQDKCIMAATSGHISPQHWSSCSQNSLQEAFELGMDYCLQDLPPAAFQGPVCGNGVLEGGEECDCGLTQDCTNRCCNSTTCRLHPQAACGAGHCCDFTSCQVKEASTRCRDAANECDLPEFCDGTSQFCPGDFYLQDGKPCASGQSYCYRGQCRTHTGQCQLLWGETGRVSDPLCFQHLNVWGTRDGNCGYNWTTERYHTCERENVMCGLLHCVHLNEKLMFWRDNLALTMRANFLSRGNQQYTCRSTMLDVGLDMPDPGMVPDGAKCEDKKICIKQTCTPLLKLKIPKCPDCHGNGVCNNAGHCHCEVGYKPPLCDRPGYGGSINSGPATNQYANRKLLIGLLVLFLVIIPLLVLVVIAYLNRRRLAAWLKQEPRGRFSALRRTNHPPAPPRPQPSNGVSQKRWSSAPNRANPRLDISGPLLEPPPAVDGTTTPDRASSNPPPRPEAPPRPIYKPSASRPAGLSLAGGHSGPPPAYPDATAARGDVRNVTASGVAGSGVKASSSSSSSRPASQATPKPKPTSATRSQGMPAPNTANPKASSQQSERGPKKVANTASPKALLQSERGPKKVANTASPKALLQSERGPKKVANTASPKALQSERGPKKVATGRPSLSPPTSPSRASKQIGHSQPVREPKNGNTGENPSSPPRASKPIGLSQSVCEPRSGDHSGENLLPKRQSFRGADISSPVLVSTTNRDSKVFADFEVDQSGVIARPVQTHHSFHSASPASSRDGMRSPVRRTMSDRPFSPPTGPGVGEEEGEETGMAFTPRPLPPEPVYEDEPVYMNEELSDLGDLEAHISSAFDGLYRNVPDQDTDTTTTTPTTPSTMPHPPTQPPTPAGNRSDNLSKPAESKHSTGPPRPAILPKVSSSGMSQNPANKPAGREENQGAKNPIRTGSGSQPPPTSKSSSVASKAQSLENKLAGGSGPKHTPPQSAGRGGGSVRPATVNTQGSGPNRGQAGIAQSSGTSRGPPGGSASKGQKPSAQSQLPGDRGSKPAGAAGKNSAAVSNSSDAPGMGSLAVKRLGEGGAGRGVGEGVSSGGPNPGRPSLAPKPAASGKPVRSYKF